MDEKGASVAADSDSKRPANLQVTSPFAKEEGESSTKKRSLLQVPSRSSSQKNDPSPTSTGLSGVTASDPAENSSRRSKESKTSFIRKKGDGSAASSVNRPTTSRTTGGDCSGPSQTMAPRSGPRPKKKGLLAFLTCCGVPDDANTVDEALPANKIARASPTPDHAETSSKAKPTDMEPATGGSTLVSEKEEPTKAETSSQVPATTSPESGAGSEGGFKPSFENARAQTMSPTSEEAEQKTVAADLATTPDIVEQKSPVIPQPDSSTSQTTSTDAPVLPPTAIVSEVAPPVGKAKDEDSTTTELPPPPPPAPEPVQSERSMVQTQEPAEERQQWLLPPIAQRFQGKKCLVLDLDETLVHSSFKVRVGRVFQIIVSLTDIKIADPTSSGFYHPS